MNTQLATRLNVRTRASGRALVISALGPLTMLAGLTWAFAQPYRVTLLHPRGETVWWLLIEPPLLVIVVGAIFSLFVVPGLLEDLAEAEDEDDSAG